MSEVGYLKLEFVSQGYTLVLTLLVRVVWVNFPENRSICLLQKSSGAWEVCTKVDRQDGHHHGNSGDSLVWRVGVYFYDNIVQVRMKKVL